MFLSEVIDSVREVSFDRFVTPAFYLKSKSEGDKLTITGTSLIVLREDNTERVRLEFSDYPTLAELTIALVERSNILDFSYGPAYRGAEKTTELLKKTDVPVDELIGVYRRTFFSDASVFTYIQRYFYSVISPLAASYQSKNRLWTVEEIDQYIQEKFNEMNAMHCVLWVSYDVVEDRRLAEVANEYLVQSSVASGEGVLAFPAGDGSVSINIGDVYRLDESRATKYNEGERAYRPGADNVLGDADSFWYKLGLFIRKRLKDVFGDDSKFSDQLVSGQMVLWKDYNWYSYYDSYPYTLSPFTRGIFGAASTYVDPTNLLGRGI